MFAINIICQVVEVTIQVQCLAAEHVPRYFAGPTKYGIMIGTFTARKRSRKTASVLFAYIDNDCSWNIEFKRSTSGHFILFRGDLVGWHLSN